MTSLRIGIVGAGFGGCAAAIALGRDGHAVTVLEAVESPGPVGAGIMLQPSGMLALAELGVLGAVLTHGERCERLRCVKSDGRVLFDLPYAARHPELFGLGIHRGALFEALYRAVPGASARVELGVIATSVDDRFVVDAAGHRHGPFDLIVVADGARSRLRKALGHATRDDEYPWGALWFVAKDPERRFRDELCQYVDGPRAMLGLLPTGSTPSDPTPQVSLFYSVRLDRVAALRARGLDAWKEQALALAPVTAPVLAQIDAFDALLVAGYRDVRMPRLDHGRLVYLGDAAHAMSPQLGQGSNLAILDALALRDALRALPLARALPAYSYARRDQLRFYQWMSRLLTPFFQGDSSVLGLLRDVLMPLSSRVPLLRGQMIATMCGVKQGLLRASLPVATERLLLPASASES